MTAAVVGDLVRLTGARGGTVGYLTGAEGSGSGPWFAFVSRASDQVDTFAGHQFMALIHQNDIAEVLANDYDPQPGDQCIMGGLAATIEAVEGDVITVRTIIDRERPKTSKGWLQFNRTHTVKRATLASENT